MLESNSVEYNLSIEPNDARILAHELITDESIDRNFENKIYEHLSQQDDVDSIADATMVTLFAYTLPETSLTEDDVIRTHSWDELVSTVMDAYLDLPERALFKDYYIDGNPHNYEFRVQDQDTTPVFDDSNEFEFEPATYETKTVDILNFGAQTKIGGVGHGYGILPNMGIRAQRMLELEIHDLIPSIEDSLENDATNLYDLYEQLYREAYEPDTIILDEDIELTDREAHTISHEFETLKRTSSLGTGEAIVCDRDHYGYETTVREFEFDVYQDYSDIGDIPGFDPIRIRVSAGKNWFDLYPDAITRGVIRPDELPENLREYSRDD